MDWTTINPGWERKRVIVEHTGAELWDWIEETFGGLTIEEIEDLMHEAFEWEDTHGLARAIHEELI